MVRFSKCHTFLLQARFNFFKSNLHKVGECPIELLFGCPSIQQQQQKKNQNTIFSHFFTSSLKINFGCETLKIDKFSTILTNYWNELRHVLHFWKTLRLLYLEKLFLIPEQQNEVKQNLFLLLLGKQKFLGWLA